MMTEIAGKTTINPNEILFVVDFMTGQDGKAAKTFNEKLNFAENSYKVRWRY